ncbi:MAG: DnaJ-like cysteine-rich domain-containing protein [Candidatus Hodarchaeales archaeon]|jgi:hypothetical protein
MRLSTPDPDEVFNKWLSSVDSKKINKAFGVVKEAITAAENVKDVEKSAFLYFNSKILTKKKSSEGKGPKPEEIDYSKLKGVKFYSFPESIDTNAWKGKDYVPMLKNLKEDRCDKCGGKGSKKCDRCNNSRQIICEDCKGKGIICDTCRGSGKITIELEVREVDKKGKQKKKVGEKRTHQCSFCFGSGRVICKKCGGTGKTVCYECKGNPKACQKCNGIGVFFKLFDSLVPLTITPGKKHYSFMVKKDEWMLKDKEYSQKLESAESYPIQNSKRLNEKDIKELFGVISLNKDLKKCIDDTRKTRENLEKDYNKKKSSERPLKPISLVFLLRLAIITPKNKKFDIYALGTKNRYSIMTNRF